MWRVCAVIHLPAMGAGSPDNSLRGHLRNRDRRQPPGAGRGPRQQAHEDPNQYLPPQPLSIRHYHVSLFHSNA